MMPTWLSFSQQTQFIYTKIATEQLWTCLLYSPVYVWHQMILMKPGHLAKRFGECMNSMSHYLTDMICLWNSWWSRDFDGRSHYDRAIVIASAATSLWRNDMYWSSHCLMAVAAMTSVSLPSSGRLFVVCHPIVYPAHYMLLPTSQLKSGKEEKLNGVSIEKHDHLMVMELVGNAFPNPKSETMSFDWQN